VAFHGGAAWPARNAAQWRTPCEAAGGSGRAIAHPLVNGWSSSVMRSKREGVWCILFAVTVDLAGGGWLGSVAVRGWDGGWFAEAAWVATELSRLILDNRDWLEALLGRWFLSELEGSEAGVELGRWESLERVPLECRGRIAGFEMVAMAPWVLSKAATARARMALDERWSSLGDGAGMAAAAAT